MKIVMTMLICGLNGTGGLHGQASLLPPVQPVVRHYTAVKVVKQSAQLLPAATTQATNTITLTATLLATNEIQFCGDLTSGSWTTVASFAWPEVQTNVPAQGQSGFYRLKTTWSGGSMLSTNVASP